MELINTGGRPIKELTEIDAIQVEALAAVCTKSQMAAYFGMTEKMFRAAGADSLKSLPFTGEVER